MPLETIVRKRENAGSQYFLLSPQCLVPYQRKIKTSAILKLLSANAFNLNESKILSFGRELRDNPVELG